MSILSDGGRIATFLDESIGESNESLYYSAVVAIIFFSKYNILFSAHAPGAARLEHQLQTFTEFGSDRSVSLHVCSLYTVARLESGTLYWWCASFYSY